MLERCVVDISHYQGPCNFQAAKADGIRKVICKASEGTSLDPAFATYVTQSTAAGVTPGGYHFGTGDDPKAQAEAFLKVAGNLFFLATDYEREPPQFKRPSMNIDQLAEFQGYIEKVDGRWPTVYGGDKLKEDLVERPDLWPLFEQSALWLPQYAKAPALGSLINVWSYWSLWQYTGDGIVAVNPDGTKRWRTDVNGIGDKLDLSHFNGSDAGLDRMFAP